MHVELKFQITFPTVNSSSGEHQRHILLLSVIHQLACTNERLFNPRYCFNLTCSHNINKLAPLRGFIPVLAFFDIMLLVRFRLNRIYLADIFRKCQVPTGYKKPLSPGCCHGILKSLAVAKMLCVEGM